LSRARIEARTSPRRALPRGPPRPPRPPQEPGPKPGPPKPGPPGPKGPKAPRRPSKPPRPRRPDPPFPCPRSYPNSCPWERIAITPFHRRSVAMRQRYIGTMHRATPCCTADPHRMANPRRARLQVPVLGRGASEDQLPGIVSRAGSSTTTAVSEDRRAAYASRFVSISRQRSQSRNRSSPTAA